MFDQSRVKSLPGNSKIASNSGLYMAKAQLINSDYKKYNGKDANETRYSIMAHGC